MLTFLDTSHRYRLDGKAVPNVTTILSGGIPKPALVGWAARKVAEAVATDREVIEMIRTLGTEPLIAALSAVPNQVRNAAADRGTTIHALADAMARRGRVDDVPADLEDALRGYAAWIDEFDPRVMLSEAMVANREMWYAGRFDLVATIGADVWLLDIKTSSGVYGETALQLAAYARAEFYVTDPDTGIGAPMIPVDRIGVLHVTESGTDLYDMGSIEAAWDEFKAALTIYRTNTRRKNLVGEPVAFPGGIERNPIPPRVTDWGRSA